MAKSKRRRLRQKQSSLEAESSMTDSGGTSMNFAKRTKLSATTRQVGQQKASALAHGKSSPSLHAGNVCYDAVICHSSKDGEIALEVKTWLEENIPQQVGSSTRPSKVELIGTISANYATSLELASKRTKTMIVLCTKRFCHDAVFKKAVHALWSWEAGRDLQVFPLLVGFEEQEPAPECISVRDAHVLHFEDCKYFRHVMAQRLSRSSAEEHSQHADEAQGRRCAEKAAPDKPRQEHGDKRYRPFSRNVQGEENRGLGSYRGGGGGVGDPGADNYDSGVPSTGDWPGTPPSSLFGPRGFSHDPTLMAVEERLVEEEEKMDTAAPEPCPAGLPEAAVYEVSERDAPQNNDEASHSDAGGTVLGGAGSQRRRPAQKRDSSSSSSSSSSSTSGTVQAKLADDSHLQTDGPQSSDGARVSPTARRDQSGFIRHTASDSTGAKRYTAWKPLRRCSLPDYVREAPEKDGYLTPVACSQDCEPYGSPYSEAGGYSWYGEASVFEYRIPVPQSQDPTWHDAHTSSESVHGEPQASRYGTATIRLNQASLKMEGGRQDILPDAAATVSPPDHGYTNTDPGSPSDAQVTATQRPSSAFQPQPSTVTGTSPKSQGAAAVAATRNDSVYDSADPLPLSRAMRIQAHTVNILEAHSVNLCGSGGSGGSSAEHKISNENLQRSPYAAKCGESAYQTWPCKSCGPHQVAAAAAAAAAEAVAAGVVGLSEETAGIERKKSTRSQPLPPLPDMHYIPTGDENVYKPSRDGAFVYGSSCNNNNSSSNNSYGGDGDGDGKTAKTRTSFASILSRLRVLLLLPCYRRKKRRQKDKNETQEIELVLPDIEDPTYSSITYLPVIAPVTDSRN